MANRRKFLKSTGAFALGSFIIPLACTPRQGERTRTAGDIPVSSSLGPIGLQLYSIRDVLEQDLKGNLKQLADMGYKEVESYPGKEGHYYGLSAEEFSTIIRDLGMDLVSSHVGSGAPDAASVDWRQATLTQNFEALVEQAAKTGQRYLTCSYLHDGFRQRPDDLKRTIDLFNRSGEICKSAGIQFAYHNHAFEFEKIGDVVLFDYMLENTDEDLVKFELDMYWVVRGGKDIKDYLTRYPNRFPLGHVKDMSKEDESQNAILGTGSINYEDVLRVAKESGMKHFLVEQETYTISSMESMRKNIEYLSALEV